MILILVFAALGVPHNLVSRIAHDDVNAATSQAERDKVLPEVLKSVLPQVKAQTRIPILLPSRLPEAIGRPKHAIVQETEADQYAICLYYKLGVGDAAFAAAFSGVKNPGYNPQELTNVSEVELAAGLRGYFTPILCGGSCAATNLWWESGGVLYQIQLKLISFVKDEARQKRIMVEAANSAILAGPR